MTQNNGATYQQQQKHYTHGLVPEPPTTNDAHTAVQDAADENVAAIAAAPAVPDDITRADVVNAAIADTVVAENVPREITVNKSHGAQKGLVTKTCNAVHTLCRTNPHNSMKQPQVRQK